jgi:hypothetical protein
MADEDIISDPEQLERLEAKADLEDQAEIVGKMKPRQYAQLRGIYPQRVYQAIRNGRLEGEQCACGSRIIDVGTADELFGFTAVQNNLEAATSVHREDLET